MSHSIRAGLSLTEFEDSELWKIKRILDTYFIQKEQEYKNSWEQTRMIAASMVGSDNVKLPWDNETKKSELPTAEEFAKHQDWVRRMDKEHKKNYLSESK